FYFAGHGGSEIKGSRKSGQLLLPQAPRQNYDAIKNGVLPIVYLERFANKLTQKGAMLVLMIDACYAGLMAESSLNAPYVKKQLQQDFDKEGVSMMMSCGSYEESFENDKQQAGMFTTELISLIIGQISFNDLEKSVQNNSYNKQTPCLAGLPPKEAFHNLQSMIDKSNKHLSIGVIQAREQRLYDQFSEARAQNRLLSPEQESAYYYVKQLQNQHRQSPLTLKATAQLVNALLQQPQEITKRYVDEDIYVNFMFSAYFRVDTSEFKEALENMQAILTLVPPDALHYNQLKAQKLWFEFMVAAPKNFQAFYATRHLLDEAIALDSTAVLAHHRLGLGIIHAHSLVNIDRISEALEPLNKVEALAPNWSFTYNSLGLYYYSTHDFKKALDFYELGLKKNINNPYIYGNRAYIYYNIRDYNKAVEELNQQIYIYKCINYVITPEDSLYLHTEFHRCYMQLEDTAKAYLHMTQAVQLINRQKSRSEKDRMHELFFIQLPFYLLTNRYEQAIAIVNEYLQKVQPQDRYANFLCLHKDPSKFTFYAKLLNIEAYKELLRKYSPECI
ncbi:MAG TPA: caspase family protein, partial [Chitinophagales bacterium]|nr:caspase family protein [Chitinophagales bacterium]